MSATRWTRRQLLRGGAGVTLGLPWLETFAPRAAHAQTAPMRKRFIALYFPNGTASFWRPSGEGAGNAWKLSPILEPLAPVKQHVSVLTNVSNHSPFGGHVEPSHSNLCASAWTCVKPSGPGSANNAISIDQVIAGLMGKATALPSLQVGLSTLDSSPDGLPGQHSRSISWASPTEPLYKIVNPQAVFDRLVASKGAVDPAALRRRALKKSALDYVLESSTALKGKLSTSDRTRMDQFLASVRDLEQRVASDSMRVPTSCPAVGRPPSPFAVGKVPADYNRGAHADLMIDLVVMALACDLTRVVSFMLDDARSDFVYNFISERHFTAGGSTPGNKPVGGFHALQHAGDANDGFATIIHWNVEKAARLAAKLAAIDEGAAGSILDGTVITFLSGMHSGNHDGRDIPIALIGSGGKVLKTNHHFLFRSDQRLADVHLTVLQRVFGGKSAAVGASSGIISELVA